MSTPNSLIVWIIWINQDVPIQSISTKVNEKLKKITYIVLGHMAISQSGIIKKSKVAKTFVSKEIKSPAGARLSIIMNVPTFNYEICFRCTVYVHFNYEMFFRFSPSVLFHFDGSVWLHGGNSRSTNTLFQIVSGIFLKNIIYR